MANLLWKIKLHFVTANLQHFCLKILFAKDRHHLFNKMEFRFSSAVTLNKTCNVCMCSFQSKSSLDQMESQSADAEPPPPPKPELRYPGLPRADTEGKTHTNTHIHLGSKQLNVFEPQMQLFQMSLLVSCHSESSLLTEAPPTPSMYKYRPAYNSPGRNHTALTHPNKVRLNLDLDRAQGIEGKQLT